MAQTEIDATACSNTNPCPCPGVKCSSHGKCCECIVKHRQAGNVPYCLRETVNEMFDRFLKRREEQKKTDV